MSWWKAASQSHPHWQLLVPGPQDRIWTRPHSRHLHPLHHHQAHTWRDRLPLHRPLPPGILVALCHCSPEQSKDVYNINNKLVRYLTSTINAIFKKKNERYMDAYYQISIQSIGNTKRHQSVWLGLMNI